MKSNGRHIDAHHDAVKPAVWAFTLTYAVLICVFSIISYFLDLTVSSGINAAIIVCAAYMAMKAFVRSCHEVPSVRERRRLAWYSLLSSYVISVTAFVVLRALHIIDTDWLADLTGAHIILFGVGAIIVTALYYLLLGLVYLFFGKVVLSVHRKSRMNPGVRGY